MPKKPSTDEKPAADEEEEDMLDVAEHCFIKIAELMIKQGITVR